MVFPSIEFAIFFPIVLTLSWVLMPRPRLWKPFIIVASYVFYASASWTFCFLLAGVTFGNQLAAVLIGRSEGQRRRTICFVAVALDLLVLGIFKYYGFFAQQVADVTHKLGLGLPLPLVAIALPVGVSFYTFQAISYTVDVYRGVVKPAKTIDVTLYLSFFSHVVAGPIVRAREFLPQLSTPRDPRDVAVGSGVFLIAMGLVKKVMIADFLGRVVVDPVFGVPQAYGTWDVLLASYAYAAQIYCDFSGYTDIAIGVALLMGIVFPQNFNSPYRALSFQDFWRRWHMTLSRFLRDFLYIPLGGSRGSRLFTARNIMITMVLGGLWHGAAWTFVLWGALHGVCLVVERFFRQHTSITLPVLLRWAIVFNIVVLGWVLFRSQSLSLVGTFLSRLAHPSAPTLWTAPVFLALAVAIGFQVVPRHPLYAVRGWFERLNPVALGVGLAVVVMVVSATIPSSGVPPFIYFRF